MENFHYQKISINTDGSLLPKMTFLPDFPANFAPPSFSQKSEKLILFYTNFLFIF